MVYLIKSDLFKVQQASLTLIKILSPILDDYCNSTLFSSLLILHCESIVAYAMVWFTLPLFFCLASFSSGWRKEN